MYLTDIYLKLFKSSVYVSTKSLEFQLTKRFFKEMRATA